MEIPPDPPTEESSGVTWAIEVPLLTNRLIWREVFSVATTAWLGCGLLVSLGFWLAWRENPDDTKGSLLIGLAVTTAVIWGSVLMVTFIYFLFKSSHRFRFTLDRHQASSLFIKSKTTRAMAGMVGVLAALADRPGLAAAGAVGAGEGRIRRIIPWRKLRRMRLHPDLLAISLYRRPWPFLPLVLYLPHQEAYDQVAGRIRELCPNLDVR